MLLMVVGWTLVLATFAILRHERLNSSTYDLAIKSQVIWNTFQGRFFASSIEVEQYLGDHVQLIMVPLAPLYGLWADVRLLLIVQALLLSLGAIPVYRIARRRLEDSGWALLFAAAYLLYPTVGFVSRFGFHPLTFVILFLLLAFDFLESERPGWASVFVLLALLCREDVGFTVFALGLYVMLVWRRRVLGAAWAVAGLAWSLLAIFVVIPHFRGAASDTMARYAWLGSDLGAIVTTLVTRPQLVWQHVFGEPLRWQFLVKLLLPVGFLSLLAPSILAIGLPALAYNLLSATPSQSSIYFQYVSPVIPFIFIAAIYGQARLRRLAQRWPPRRQTAVFAAWLGAAVVFAWLLDNPFTEPIRDPYFPVYALEAYSDGAAFREAKALLPPEAPVATMMAYGPHLSLRPQLYLFHDGLRREERPYGFPQTEYALLNLTDLRWGVNARLFYAMIETAIGLYDYGAVYFNEDVLLLQRGAPPQPATGAALQRVIALLEAGGEFAPAAPSTLEWMGRQWLRDALPGTVVTADVQFGDAVHLLGYALPQRPAAPGEPLCAVLYWQAEAPLAVDYTVFFHFAAADGFVHAQRDRVPALGFYPTTSWQPGEIVADMHCLQVPPQLPAGTYHVNAGLYEPATLQRLPVTGGDLERPAPGAVRLATLTLKQPSR